MNILVLGGNGFIGSHLVDKLLANGHAIRVVDQYQERYRKMLPGVEYRFFDFGNRGLLEEALKNIDIVFHLIWTTLPKTSNDDPAFDVQSNVIGTLFLFEKCVLSNVKKIIFLSSGGTIYGNPIKVPVSEENPTNPECSYGITKLIIEKYLALYSHLYGIDYMIARPSNPYGERQDPTGIQGAIAVFLGKIARGEPIEIWGNGEIVRDYIYIYDLVEGIYKATVMNPTSRIFNIGSGMGHSLNELLVLIRKNIDCELKIFYKKKRTFDVAKIYLDISKAKNELLWEPKITIDVGIQRTWKFIKSLYK